MKTIATYSVALAALVLAATATASPHQHITAPPVSRQVAGLRHQIGQHRSRTWHFQDLAGVAHTPTRYTERHTRSVPYLHWVNDLWGHRQRAARHTALVHPAVAHLDLWLCIHGGEGNSGSSPQHPNSGPLQMTPYWAGYPIADWSMVPVYRVYRDAETQLRIHMAHGDALAWLWSQWWGDNHCFYLA